MFKVQISKYKNMGNTSFILASIGVFLVVILLLVISTLR